MSVQRFNIVSDKDGWYRHEPAENGAYILFTDHQSSLAERELRITELRESIIHLLADIANAEHEDRPVSDFYIKLARAAL